MRWIAILSAFALAACSTVADNSETQESINQKIAKGKTTKAEVKATFGEPSSTTSKERGSEEWRYKIASSSSTLKIPGFERFFGSGTEKDKTLLVDFDRRGIVTNYSLNEEAKRYVGSSKSLRLRPSLPHSAVRCLLHLSHPTLVMRASRSRLCQKETHALQQG